MLPPFPSAPAMYAAACGRECTGPDRCYWCGAPCPRLLPHDDPRPTLGMKANPHARCPGNQYQCNGCWLFARKKVTVRWVAGDFTDGLTPARLSWWITPNAAAGIRPGPDSHAMYAILLRPPLRFTLSLLAGTNQPPNRLQMALANDHREIKAGTPLTFTINGIPFAYTVYELEEALKTGDASGCEPGVRELTKLLGDYPPLKPQKIEKQGRPPGSRTQPNITKDVVTAPTSGGVLPATV